MKRIGIGLAVALGLAAAGWAGAWWWAGQTMLAKLDAELAQLAEAGVTVTAERRTLGGFPLRLDLRQEGLSLAARSGLWRLDVDSAVSSASVLSPAQVRTTVGGDSMARVGTLTLADGGVPLTTLAIGARGLIVDTPLDPAAPVALVSAAALSLVDTGGAALHELVLDLEGLSARVARHAVPAVAENGHRVDLRAAHLALAVSPRGPQLQRTELTADDVRLDGTLAGLRGADLSAALAAPGQLVLGVEAADAVVLTLDYDPAASDAVVDFATLPVRQAVRVAGRLGQRLTVADGRIAVESSGSGLALDVVHPAFGGRFAVPEAVARFMMPLREAPMAEPFALEARLTDVQPDEATWAEIDPRARLERAPLALTLDIRGEARLLGALGAAAMAGQPPLRVERIEINALDFSGFGADAALTGTLTPVPGQPAPDGTLSLRLDGWSSLLRALETTGVLDPVQSMLVAEVAASLRDPAGGDGLRAEVEMSRGGLVVNGRRYR